MDADRTVGLLFVHGIGEQKPFDHIRTEVTRLVELLRCTDPDAQVAVIDRTASKKPSVGQPRLGDNAPVSLTVVSQGVRTHYDCHEVWWADLGKRQSLSESISFWIWGLGQWSAPFYRRLDLSHTRESHDPSPRPLTVLPDSVAGAFWLEVRVRLQLWLAALGAVLSVATLSLLKTLVRRVFGGLPGPTLVVQYLGDVQTYEERARPNRSALSDPGHPLRVGIRRRMIGEMVAMAGRRYDQWHILAHSLGTVVAFNGLTELGHTLPNYLTKELWDELPEPLKVTAGVRRRVEAEIPMMMPGRPAWLSPTDVLHRRALFEKLGWFVTYGSPLDKFAAIWPRIIAVADDMEDGASALNGTRWLNIAAPHDPVAGVLHAFAAGTGGPQGAQLQRLLPRQANWLTARDIWVGLSHIRYLNSWSTTLDPRPEMEQRKRLCRLLFNLKREGPASDHPDLGDDLSAAGFPSPWLLYVLVFTLLIGATTVLSWTAIKGILAVAGKSQASLASDAVMAGLLALGVAFAVTALAGLFRWWREAELNVRAARPDRKLAAFARNIRADALLMLVAGAPLLCLAVLHDVNATIAGWGTERLYNHAALIIAPVLILMAVLAQSWHNKRGPK